MNDTTYKDTIKQFHKKYSDRNIPWTVHWEFTYKCNLNCVYCYTNNEDKSKYLTLLQIESIVNQLKEMGTIFIIVSGGEPFIRDDIMEVLDILRRDFYVVILTNATLIDSDRAKRLKELKVSSVEVSLFAMDEGIHDDITGIKGSHAETMRGIYWLKAEGVPIRIKNPLMAQNASEYPAVFDFAKRLGVLFSASPQIIPRMDGSLDTYNNSINDKQLEEYYIRWCKNNSEKAEALKKQPDPMNNEEFTCNAGRTTCSITPDGYLKPCSIITVKLGNLLERTFKELWLGKSDRFLKNLRMSGLNDYSRCNSCEHASVCAPCPGANWLESGDAFTTAEGYCGLMKGIGNIVTKRRDI